MDIKLERLNIVKEKKSYFIGKDHRRKKYRILKNSYSEKFRVGDDRYMYFSIVKQKLFYLFINPVSHEEYLKTKNAS